MTKIKKEIAAFMRMRLDDRLSQITQEQRAIFGRYYPEPIDDAEIETAINLCDRTIRKNEADRVAHDADEQAAVLSRPDRWDGGE